jgi:hypothetical protein
VVAAVAVGLAGCASTVDTTGSLNLYGAFSPGSPMGAGRAPCVGTAGYSDVRGGTPVVIYNQAGEIVATTSLEEGQPLNAAGSCLYSFKVTGVPDSDFYQVEVSHRGKVTFTREQFEGDDVALTLGPA